MTEDKGIAVVYVHQQKIIAHARRREVAGAVDGFSKRYPGFLLERC